MHKLFVHPLRPLGTIVFVIIVTLAHCAGGWAECPNAAIALIGLKDGYSNSILQVDAYRQLEEQAESISVSDNPLVSERINRAEGGNGRSDNLCTSNQQQTVAKSAAPRARQRAQAPNHFAHEAW